MGMNMDQYTAEFTARGVDGLQLLHLDSDKLKVRNSERRHAAFHCHLVAKLGSFWFFLCRFN